MEVGAYPLSFTQIVYKMQYLEICKLFHEGAALLEKRFLRKMGAQKVSYLWLDSWVLRQCLIYGLIHGCSESDLFMA